MKTAEFVSPMHPDKICDRISGAILDECLKQDSNARVAVETLGGHNKIVVMGEITTNAELNIKEIIQKEINNQNFDIVINIKSQSSEIARGVDVGGAGDQGIMIGYACNENKDMIPLEYYYARSLCHFIFDQYPYDGKTQISINNSNNITDIVVSFQNVSGNILKEKTME
jgi:S-adenosylmethionine synthetase